jgi:CRP-like cAMP-binding protein
METKKITALQRTTLFGCLPAKVLADIAISAVEMHFPNGKMLFFSGETAKGIFVVMSGEIRVFQQNADGREQVMHIVLRALS